MLLAEVVATSSQIASTSKRLAKIDRLSSLLQSLKGEEIEIVVYLLSGSVRQGKVGIGWAMLQEASLAAPPAAEPSITLAEFDHFLTEYASIKGRGSEQRRRELITAFFARATAPEQQFLKGLLTGEQIGRASCRERV